MKLIPLFLLLPFFALSQSLEIKNESMYKCVKVITNVGEKPEAGEIYTIRALVNPSNEIIFIYKQGDRVILAVSKTKEITKGVKWKAKAGETLLILVRDKA